MCDAVREVCGARRVCGCVGGIRDHAPLTPSQTVVNSTTPWWNALQCGILHYAAVRYTAVLASRICCNVTAELEQCKLYRGFPQSPACCSFQRRLNLAKLASSRSLVFSSLVLRYGQVLVLTSWCCWLILRDVCLKFMPTLLLYTVAFLVARFSCGLLESPVIPFQVVFSAPY